MDIKKMGEMYICLCSLGVEHQSCKLEVSGSIPDGGLLVAAKCGGDDDDTK